MWRIYCPVVIRKFSETTELDVVEEDNVVNEDILFEEVF